jgi:uncharacterized membrane protein YgcG
MRRLLVAIACVAVLLCISAPLHAVDAARIALSRKVPQMNLNGVALVDAIDFIRDLTNSNLHVNWKAIEAAGVGKDTQVNLRVRDIRLDKVLTLMLNDAGGGSELLTFFVDSGVIEITTREEADKQVFTKVYPIQDLIVEVPDFEGPDFNISQNNTPNSGGGGGGGGGGSGIFGGGGGSNRDNDKTQTTREERAQQLIDVIVNTIRPDVWQVNGGTAAIRYFNGNLIVTAPRSIHEALGGYVD